jgi:trimeric autotransporter adhesin
MTTDTFNSGAANWTVPAGVTSVEIELWGAGGGGAAGRASFTYTASGGGAIEPVAHVPSAFLL